MILYNLDRNIQYLVDKRVPKEEGPKGQTGANQGEGIRVASARSEYHGTF